MLKGEQDDEDDRATSAKISAETLQRALQRVSDGDAGQSEALHEHEQASRPKLSSCLNGDSGAEISRFIFEEARRENDASKQLVADGHEGFGEATIPFSMAFHSLPYAYPYFGMGLESAYRAQAPALPTGSAELAFSSEQGRMGIMG